VLASLKGANFDQGLGIDIVRKAIQAPARRISENAGQEGAVIVGRVLEHYVAPKDGLKDTSASGAAGFNYGYNAQLDTYVDMIKEGIIDPLKVVRTALVDSSGVASLLTTSECMIVDAPKKDAPAMPPMGGMGGMGGMM
jgi:chaperonin GroEL